MPREIKSAASAVHPTPLSSANDFKERLVKLIPSEIVTAYITIQGIIKGAKLEADSSSLIWAVSIVLMVVTPLYLYHVTNVRKWGQILLTTLAFSIWVMVIGSPIPTILGYPAEFVASIFLIIYTLFIPVVYKG